MLKLGHAQLVLDCTDAHPFHLASLAFLCEKRFEALCERANLCLGFRESQMGGNFPVKTISRGLSLFYDRLDGAFVPNIWPRMKLNNRIDEDEAIITVIQDHWMIMAIPFLLYILGLALMVAVFFMGELFTDALSFLDPLLKLLSVLTLLVIHHWLFIYLFFWEVSGWVVTTRRLIGFSFLPYVRHDTNFIQIHEIHEVEKKKHGMLQNLLNYGTLEINLAASPDLVVIRYVPAPSEVVNLIEAVYGAQTEEEGDFNLKEFKQRFKL